MVRVTLGSDKAVVQEHSLLLSADMSKEEKRDKQNAQLQRGAQACLDSGDAKIEHTGEAFLSLKDAMGAVKSEQKAFYNYIRTYNLIHPNGGSELPAVLFHEGNPRGYKVDVSLDLVGYHVCAAVHTKLAPNGSGADGIARVTEATYYPPGERSAFFYKIP